MYERSKMKHIFICDSISRSDVVRAQELLIMSHCSGAPDHVRKVRNIISTPLSLFNLVNLSFIQAVSESTVSSLSSVSSVLTVSAVSSVSKAIFQSNVRSQIS